jgi:hypothetical protein
MSMGTIGRSLAWLATGVVLAIGVMLATQGWRGSPEAAVLRSYEVKPEVAVEISNALRMALSTGKDGAPYGQVTLSPNGQLLVTAPPSVQQGVAKILEDIATRKPPSTPTIRFEAWLVAAAPGERVDSPNLKELEPALRAVEESKGSMRFELLEKLSTQVRSGQRSEIQGQRSTMEVNTSIRRDSKDQPVIAARIELQLLPSSAGEFNSSNVFTPGRGSGLEAQTEMRPGELLVVGQSSLSDKSAPDRELYYIVRAAL